MSLLVGAMRKTEADSDPRSHAEVVSLVADNTFDSTRLLYIGVSGNLTVVTAGGETVTFTGLIGGTFLPVCVAGVVAAGATVTDVVACW